MAKNNVLNLKLPSADDLFTTQEERENSAREHVENIALCKIDDFPDHPFHVVHDAEMNDLVESIQKFGVYTPAIVRPQEDGRYMLISGHRRKMACELAGLEVMPVVVRDMSMEAATILMVDSNIQREKVSPSEKARAYKMKMDAMRRQGARTDLTDESTCAPLGHKLKNAKARDILAIDSGDSKSQVQRYLRLNELSDPLLDMVDEGKIAMRPAVELSYLPREKQEKLLEAIEAEEATPSLAQAQRMRKFSEDGRLDENSIFAILTEEKPNQRDKITLPRERIAAYLPKNVPEEKAADFIVKACEHYAKYLQRNAQER